MAHWIYGFMFGCVAALFGWVAYDDFVRSHVERGGVAALISWVFLVASIGIVRSEL